MDAHTYLGRVEAAGARMPDLVECDGCGYNFPADGLIWRINENGARLAYCPGCDSRPEALQHRLIGG